MLSILQLYLAKKMTTNISMIEQLTKELFLKVFSQIQITNECYWSLKFHWLPKISMTVPKKVTMRLISLREIHSR
jgi:hypothetical protein